MTPVEIITKHIQCFRPEIMGFNWLQTRNSFEKKATANKQRLKGIYINSWNSAISHNIVLDVASYDEIRAAEKQEMLYVIFFWMTARKVQ